MCRAAPHGASRHRTAPRQPQATATLSTIPITASCKKLRVAATPTHLRNSGIIHIRSSSSGLIVKLQHTRSCHEYKWWATTLEWTITEVFPRWTDLQIIYRIFVSKIGYHHCHQVIINRRMARAALEIEEFVMVIVLAGFFYDIGGRSARQTNRRITLICHSRLNMAD